MISLCIVKNSYLLHEIKYFIVKNVERTRI